MHDFCQNTSAPPVPLAADRAYLSLASSAEMDVIDGRGNCTLSIKTSIGQQVKLKIYDFTRTNSTEATLRADDNACPVTMTMKEVNEDHFKPVKLCSLDGSRDRVVATSDSSAVSLIVDFKERSMPHFLLYYEGEMFM